MASLTKRGQRSEQAVLPFPGLKPTDDADDQSILWQAELDPKRDAFGDLARRSLDARMDDEPFAARPQMRLRLA
jgi:hypothetical protein